MAKTSSAPAGTARDVPNNNAPTYLTRREAAGLANMSLEWIKARIADRTLPHYKFGRAVRIERGEFVAFLRDLRGGR